LRHGRRGKEQCDGSGAALHGVQPYIAARCTQGDWGGNKDSRGLALLIADHQHGEKRRGID
jgi:hypothetical protein